MAFVPNGTWACLCRKFYVESKQLNKKGKPISFPVEVRTADIRGSFIMTDWYKVTLIKRNKERLYCVKERKKPNRPWWDKTPLKDEDYKWVKEGTYTRDQFLGFLRGRVLDPLAMVVDLETCPPEPKDMDLAA